MLERNNNKTVGMMTVATSRSSSDFTSIMERFCDTASTLTGRAYPAPVRTSCRELIEDGVYILSFFFLSSMFYLWPARVVFQHEASSLFSKHQ